MVQSVLEVEDAAVLEEAGLLTPAVSGMRRVADSTIYPNHASSSGSDDSAPGASSRTSNFIEIPDLLESQETLGWLGMDRETSRMLFDRWTHWAEDDPTPFVATAIDHVRYSTHDATGLQNDWEAAMKQMGVARELRDAILDPEFQQVRSTRSAKDWIIDTFEMRIRVLTKANDESRERVKMIKKGSLRKVAGTWRKEDIEQAQGVSPRLSWKDEVAYPQYTPGKVTLWIGHDRARFSRAFSASGNVDLYQMLSVAPSDFCGTPASMLCTDVDKEVAQIYAQYAKKRSGPSEVALLSLQVPDALIQSFGPFILNYGDLWKTVVWTSRRGQPLRGNLAKIKAENLIIGHICKKPNVAVGKMASWEDLSDSDLIHFERDGHAVRGVQYFFKHDETISLLGDPSSGVVFEMHHVRGDVAKDFLA